VRDVERIQAEREDGITQEKRHVTLLRHIHAAWDDGEVFIGTDDLLARLAASHPFAWGSASTYGKALTAQGLGRLLTKNFNIHSSRLPDGDRLRGYRLSSFLPAFRGFALTPLPNRTDRTNRPNRTKTHPRTEEQQHECRRARKQHDQH